MKKKVNIKGFALVEILIAIAILSMILLSIYTGVSASINAITGTRNYSKAMIIAKSRLNEFIAKNMRGADISKESIEEYPGFKFSRVTKRYENDLLGPIPAQRTEIIINWEEKNAEKSYSLSYIYTEK